MKAILITLTLVLLSTFASAEDAAFDFKGIALGSNISSIAGIEKYDCKDQQNKTGPDKTCFNGNETIAGFPVIVVMLDFFSDSLHSITVAVDEKYFHEVARALEVKYGKPELTNKIIQNKLGATFENKIFEWKNKSQSIRFERYAGKLDRSMLVMTTNFYFEESSRRRAESTKSKAADL